MFYLPWWHPRGHMIEFLPTCGAASILHEDLSGITGRLYLRGYSRLASDLWFKSLLPWSELSRMSKCPWARYWTPNCSWCAVPISAKPCDELATCPECTLLETAGIGSSNNPCDPLEKRWSGYRQRHDINLWKKVWNGSKCKTPRHDFKYDIFVSKYLNIEDEITPN